MHVKWLIFRVAELELHGVGVQVGLLRVQRVRVGIFYLTLTPDVQFLYRALLCKDEMQEIGDR